MAVTVGSRERAERATAGTCDHFQFSSHTELVFVTRAELMRGGLHHEDTRHSAVKVKVSPPQVSRWSVGSAEMAPGTRATVSISQGLSNNTEA